MANNLNRRFLQFMMAAAIAACLGAAGQGQQAAKNRGAVVIELHGPAGTSLTNAAESGSCFDSRLLDAMFSAAENAGATTVVLDIDSGGGVVEQLAAMLEVIQQWKRQLQIVAYVRNANGPAAALALGCEEVIVHPAATLRAPSFASDSFGTSRVQALLESAGIDSKLAAGVVKGTVWWHQQSNQFARSPGNDRQQWVAISEKEQFTTTGQRLVGCGVASSADDIAGALATIGAGQVLDLTRRLHALQRQRASDVRTIASAHETGREAFDRLIEVVEAFEDGSRRKISHRALSRLRVDLQRCCRTIEGAAENPRFKADIPSVVSCQMAAVTSAMDAVPSDSRDLADGRERNDVITAVKAAREVWDRCE